MTEETFKEYPIAPLAGATVTGNLTAAELIDTRFDTVENALNDLSSRVYSLNTRSGVVRHDVLLDSDVGIGSLVYYDVTKGLYCNALAATLAETTAGGMTVEAPSAHVEGIILSTNNGSPLTGTMLCGGYWNDDAVTGACLDTVAGTTASPGIYYLSPTIPGKATQETYGHLRQPVLSYYGMRSGFSLSLFYMAHDNHFHSSDVLGDYWDPANVTINGSTSNFVYSGEFTAGLGAIGDTTAIFYNGVLQVPGASNNAFRIYDNKLYYMDTPAPTGLVTLFNHYPFAYGSSVVRTISSTNDALMVKNENGQVTLSTNSFVPGATTKSALAIYSINGRELNYTPVVTAVQPGPGISISRAIDGTAYISTTNNVGSLMDAYSINHDGTTLITDGNDLQYIAFPAKRVSQFVMYLPVHNISSPCQVWVWGIRAGTQLATLRVNATFIPDPTKSSPSEIVINGGTGTNLVFSAFDSLSANTLTYEEIDIQGCTVSGSGLLMATVAMTSANAQQVKLLRAGFKLTTIASNIQNDEAIVDPNAITQTLEVAPNVTIEAGDAVLVLDSGKLARCTNIRGGAANNTNRCVGIAITGATGGQQLPYMITGTMTLSVPGAVAGQSLYINSYGKIQPVADSELDAFWHGDQHNPGVNFLQKVGTILTGSKIQVNIEPAVRGTNV